MTALISVQLTAVQVQNIIALIETALHYEDDEYRRFTLFLLLDALQEAVAHHDSDT